jgi:hypothetical protein
MKKSTPSLTSGAENLPAGQNAIRKSDVGAISRGSQAHVRSAEAEQSLTQLGERFGLPGYASANLPLRQAAGEINDTRHHLRG